MSLLNVMSIIPSSNVNGPGDRYVIWTQGCRKGCRGCFNPESWHENDNMLFRAEDLAKRVQCANPYGLTLTGGDPLEQAEALLEFLECLHGYGSEFLPGGIICFTGYTVEEIENIPVAKRCLEYIDLLIDGRYVDSLRYESGLAGSSNQRFHFSKKSGRGEARISRESIAIDQEVEVHVVDGKIAVTGFPNMDRKMLKDLGLTPLRG